MNSCFTDLSDSAAWRASWLSSYPWSTVPAYALLMGFSLSMIFPDLLHVFNLGVGRDACGSILKVVLQDQQVFQGGTIEDRFQRATVSLRAYAARHGYSLRMKKLTKNKVHWKTNKYPELMASGSDTHIVCNWLEETLAPFCNNSPRFSAFCTLLWSGNQCLRTLYAGGWFLDAQEKSTVRVLGGIYAQTYICLAWDSVNAHELLFRAKPKLHLYVHIVEHPRLVNASFYSTWMDEDYLKKVSKTLGLTSAKSAQTRFLQRWLLTFPENLRRVHSTA